MATNKTSLEVQNPPPTTSPTPSVPIANVALLVFGLIGSVIGAIVAGDGTHNFDGGRSTYFLISVGPFISLFALLGAKNARAAVFSTGLFAVWFLQTLGVVRFSDTLRQLTDLEALEKFEAGFLLMYISTLISILAYPHKFHQSKHSLSAVVGVVVSFVGAACVWSVSADSDGSDTINSLGITIFALTGTVMAVLNDSQLMSGFCLGINSFTIVFAIFNGIESDNDNTHATGLHLLAIGAFLSSVSIILAPKEPHDEFWSR